MSAGIPDLRSRRNHKLSDINTANNRGTSSRVPSPSSETHSAPAPSLRSRRFQPQHPPSPASDDGSIVADDVFGTLQGKSSPPPSPGPGKSSSQNPGGLQIDAMESMPQINLHLSAQGNYYEYTEKVSWGFRPYLLTLHIPVDNKAPANEQELKNALKLYVTAFLKDLQIKNEMKGENKIKPGTSFGIVTDGNRYAAYVGSPKFEPSIDDLIQDKKNIIGEDANAIELCSILHKGSFDGIIDAVKTSTVIKTYSNPSTTTPQPTKAGPTQLRPIGFINGGNTCYLSSAVQAWASNPIIRQELLRDGVLKDVNNQPHPLKVALQKYQDAQKDTTIQSIDLSELTRYMVEEKKLKAGDQADVGEAMALLKNDITLPEDSPLHSIMQSEWSYHKPNSDPPEEVWVPKNEPPQLAQMKVRPKANEGLASLLRNQIIEPIKQSPDDNKSKIPGTDIEVTPIHKKDTFKTAPKILTIHTQRADYIQNVTQKTAVEIDVPLELHLPGPVYGAGESESTPYELMSFTHHTGKGANSGHYITYIRDGNNYWEMSDSRKTQISEGDFLQKAKTGYYLTYNIKGLTATEPKTPSADKLAQEATPAPAAELMMPQVLFDELNLKVVVGVGEITKRPANAILNFRNCDVVPTQIDGTNVDIVRLDKDNPIEKEAGVDSILANKIQAEKGFFDRLRGKKRILKIGEIVTTSPGKLKEIGEISHAMISNPASGNSTFLSQLPSIVSKFLIAAHDNKQKTVAIALPNNLPPSLIIDSIAAIKLGVDAYTNKYLGKSDALEKIEIILTQAQYDAFPKDQVQERKPTEAPDTLSDDDKRQFAEQIRADLSKIGKHSPTFKYELDLAGTTIPRQPFCPIIQHPIRTEDELNLLLEELNKYIEATPNSPIRFNLHLPNKFDKRKSEINKILNRFQNKPSVTFHEIQETPPVATPRLGFSDPAKQQSSNGASHDAQRVGGFPPVVATPSENRSFFHRFWGGSKAQQ